MRLSNLSRLIPSDFYGNRVSVKPEYLFKPWKQQYQKYNQNSNDALMKYHTSLEYKYEVTLDLKTGLKYIIQVDYMEESLLTN